MNEEDKETNERARDMCHDVESMNEENTNEQNGNIDEAQHEMKKAHVRTDYRLPIHASLAAITRNEAKKRLQLSPLVVYRTLYD